MKNAYLGARERAPLALSRMQREEQLWKRKVSSEQDYQDARQVYSEVNVLLRTAEQNLVAVGLDPKSGALNGGGRYGVTTPIVGAIIDWNIAQIGRASCRERVCQYLSNSVVALLLKKKL